MPLGLVGGAAENLNRQLGIIEGVKNRLVRQWDDAADKLVGALEEISLIHAAIDKEISDYLSLSFEDDADVRNARKVLTKLEGGSLRGRMEEARGHCHKIENIYEKYLKRWFDRVLQDDAQELHAIFYHLSKEDYAMQYQIESFLGWLPSEAEGTLDLVDAGKLKEANERIRLARKDVLPTRRAVARLMANMRDLQGEFIMVSRTT